MYDRIEDSGPTHFIATRSCAQLGKRQVQIARSLSTDEFFPSLPRCTSLPWSAISPEELTQRRNLQITTVAMADSPQRKLQKQQAFNKDRFAWQSVDTMYYGGHAVNRFIVLKDESTGKKHSP